MLLDNIALFLTIVEKGSLTAAGRETGLSPTTVSERLASLEAHYGWCCSTAPHVPSA
ncbi:helix-turn-helix domain-containing protein [Cobetia marina]